MTRVLTATCLIMALLAGGCTTTGGGTPAQQRSSILKMKDQVLAELYRQKPDVKAQIASAPGYAVFSNANVNVILASFGGGYGVVENNRDGGYTYMKMGEVGVGLGLGVKDFRLVFVFHNDAAMQRFVDKGWALGAQADAAAKASDKGGAVGGEISVDNMTIYQLTETGLALQATIKGTRFWKDEALN